MKVLFYIFKNFYQFFENSIQCVLLIFTSLPHLSLHLPLSSPPIQLYVLFLLFTHQDQFVMLKYSRIRGLQVEHGHLTRAYNLIRENWLSQQLTTTNHSPARGRIAAPHLSHAGIWSALGLHWSCACIQLLWAHFCTFGISRARGSFFLFSHM